MRSSSAPGFDLRNAVDGLREAFAPSAKPAATSDRDEGREVRAAVLVELRSRSMHGYEIIRAIETRSGGSWAPGPGAVYPTLQMLVDEALVSGEQVGERKVHSLTEAGRVAADLAEGEQRRPDGQSTSEGEAWRRGSQRDHERGPGLQAAVSLTKSGLRLAQAVSQVAQTASPERSERATALLDETRRKLYALLAEA